MGMVGKYPPSEGWTRLVPEKIVPQPTPKTKPKSVEILIPKKRKSVWDFLKNIFTKH